MDSKIKRSMEHALKTNPTEAGKCRDDYNDLQPKLEFIRNIIGIEINHNYIIEEVSTFKPKMNKLLEKVINASESSKEYIKKVKDKTLSVEDQEVRQRWGELRDMLLETYTLTLIDSDPNLYYELRRKIDDVNSTLVKLNMELKRKLPSEINVPRKEWGWNSKVKEAYGLRRKQTIHSILQKLKIPEGTQHLSNEEFSKSKRQEFENFDQLRQDLIGIVTALNAIEDALDACYLLDDRLPKKMQVQDVRTIRSLWTKWKGNPQLKSEVFATPFARITELENLSVSSSSLDLTDKALAPADKYTAWIRLGSLSPPWPNDINDVNDDRAIRATLKSKFKTIRQKDEEHGDSLLKTLAGTGIEREWTFIKENHSDDKVLVEFDEFATEKKGNAALAELAELEDIAKKLADFVSTELWQDQENMMKMSLFTDECPLYDRKVQATFTIEDFHLWLDEVKGYVKIPLPRDRHEYLLKITAKISEIEDLIKVAAKNSKANEYNESSKTLIDITTEAVKIFAFDSIEKNKTTMQEHMPLLESLWERLGDLEKTIKPEYCKYLVLKEGVITFAQGKTTLDAFEPVNKDNNTFKPLRIDKWEKFNEDRPLLEGFFEKTKGDELNIGWPKYIRSERDTTVILRFVPTGSDNPEPFYMATHEVTNAQYTSFLQFIRPKAFQRPGKLRFEDADKNILLNVHTREFDEERKCKITWQGAFVITKGQEKVPVTWVTYKGAWSYANWIDAHLPTVSQHAWASNQKLIAAHVRAGAFKKAAEKYKNSLGSSDQVAPSPVGAVKPEGYVLNSPVADANDLAETRAAYRSAWPISIAFDESRANGREIYDMVGNVWEWCENDTVNNGNALICGGSCLSPSDYANPGSQYPFKQSSDCDVGFRIVVPAR